MAENELPVGVHEISAKTTNEAGDSLSATVQVALGEDHAARLAIHGDDAVDKAFVKGATLKVQQDIRGMLNEGATPEKIVAYFGDSYKMDFTRKERNTDPKARLKRILATMSEEEQAEFFEDYEG